MYGKMVGRRGTFPYGWALLALGCALPLAAQTATPPAQQPNPAPATATSPAKQPNPAPAASATLVKHHKKSAVKPVEPPPPPQPTVAPSRFQEPAMPPVVTAGKNQLMVKADNSSLSQILRQVSSQTGMKLDGMSGDERVFGSFGPGAPREVLTSLLDGTGYNMMMVGDLPNGAPRELLLSRRASADGAPAAPPAPNPAQPNQNGDSDNPDDQEPQDFQEAPSPPSIMPAEPPQPGAPQPPQAGATPQEMMMQRQMQIQNAQPQ
jgi:hypothetical protein